MSKQYKLSFEKKYAGRKTARAISTRTFNHVVWKANRPVLRRHHRLVKRVIADAQARYDVKLKAIAVMPDHVHAVVRVGSRQDFANAMRFIGGKIALGIARAESLGGEALGVGRGRLWRQRVWSRCVSAGRDFAAATAYVWRNPVRAGILSMCDSICIVDGVLRDHIDPGAARELNARGRSARQMDFAWA